MREPAVLLGLFLAGCGMTGPPPTELSHVDIRPAADDANCRTYTAMAQIDLRQETLIGRACRVAGGGWQVTEGTAADPRRTQRLVSAETAAQYPWRSGPPVGISTGRSVLYYNWDEQRTGSRFR